MSTTSLQLQWANTLRAAATVSVILLHVSAAVDQDFKSLPVSLWLVGCCLDAAVRWAVPVFVMLTGSFALSRYEGQLRPFLKKAFLRVGLPFIFWSVIYLWFYQGPALLSNQNTLMDKASLILKGALSGTAVHLWFVYMIISMYLLIPLVSKWIRYGSKNEIQMFLFLWMFFLVVQPFLGNVDINFDYSYFSGFLGYLILGSYLFEAQRKVDSLLLIGVLFGAYLITAGGTYYLSIRDHQMNETFFDNLMPNVVVMAACIYLLFKNTQIRLPFWVAYIINKVSLYSYGIFLAHILVLTLLFRSGITYKIAYPLLSVPLITLLCLLLSFVLVFGLKKLP